MKKIIAPILLLLFISCEQNDLKQVTEPTETIEALNEYALINKIFQDIGNTTGDAILNAEESTNTKKSTQSKNEPHITVEPFDLTTFPKTITVDFLDGTLCKDGITRKGIVTIVSNNWYGQEGSEHTTTFENYYHETYKVEGTHKVKNLGYSDGSHLKYSVTIEDGKITTDVGESITYREQSYRTWIAGSESPLNIWDDQYLLEGTQNGMNSRGLEYALSITDPLHFVLLPRGIESGILKIDIGEIKDIELNYTSSTITILGVTYPILIGN
ncbi:hypothetical protein [Algibacter mikhailovii]|uniref:hypothetical protein n=1 Tax=Algibacter mikhailovii TaxID=425498 RepID=UPI002494A2B1|nr:hypothetical protein [Algibacter mikhailovii]